MVRKFFMDEDGMGTVELVLIIAALVTIALIFRKAIVSFVQDSLGSIFEGAKEGTGTTAETP